MLSKERSALLVIDMQEDYIGKKSRYHYYPDTFIDKVNERITRGQQDKELIIYIKNKGKRQGSPYVSNYVKGLQVISNYEYTKEKISAFVNSDLVTLLKDQDITIIEVIGIDGNCCVASTALDAKNLGYSVTFPIEYIGVNSKERFEKTKEKLKKAGITVI